jgi:hypothetical protein
LLNKHDIKLTLLSPPIKESRRNEIAEIKSMYKSSSFKNKVLDLYYDTFQFLPDDLYRDEIHFKNEYITEVQGEVFSIFSKY